MALAPVYIVAARRTALGRAGGLHRNRRLVELCSPVISAVLDDAQIAPTEVDEIVLGNSSEGGNPARVVGLAAGLPERTAALSLDRHCASGLDAVLAAVRAIGVAEAEVVLAGGAESISTAPWRLSKPKSLHQVPRFVQDDEDGGANLEGLEAFAQRLGIGRMRQDAFAVQSHLRAEAARAARRFVGEIVPIRANADEARDQSAVEPAIEELARITPFLPPDGTLTPGNMSAPHDGAAFVVAVSEAVWRRIGRPKALVASASSAVGVSPEDQGFAPVAALRSALARAGLEAGQLHRVEASESSAVEAIALMESLGLDESRLNADGGAIARGHPGAAAGAVAMARLFTGLVRNAAPIGSSCGAVAQGARGGIGVAAVFKVADA